jgi:cobalt-zinc-cadmium efflux system membrane fusion protein
VIARNKVVKVLALGVASVALVGIAAAAVPRFKDLFKSEHAAPPEPSVHLVAGKTNTIEVTDDVARKLGLDTPKATAEVRPPRPHALELAGTLALDTNYFVRVHSRFPGEVVQIGSEPGPRRTVLSYGDLVQGPRHKDGKLAAAGTLLAVVWSKDLGEKKSELVDAMSQFRVDSETLTRMLKYSSVIPERSIREQEAKVAQDRNAILRAERTLRVWRLSDDEINEVRSEAEQIYQSARKAFENPDDIKLDRSFLNDRIKEWGRVEVRAPFDGTVMEKNVAIGDIVDTSTDLFKIADLRHLSIWAHTNEENVPRLVKAQEKLEAEARRDNKSPARLPWTVHFLSADDRKIEEKGFIQQIGKIIDPQQHTALVMGHVDNPRGHLLAGQFATALVNLPPDPTEVEVPTDALIENGVESIVLVQSEPGRFEYQLRRVAVRRRNADYACLRTKLTDEEKKRGLTTLQIGERVVTVAALELTAVFKELKDTSKAD